MSRRMIACTLVLLAAIGRGAAAQDANSDRERERIAAARERDRDAQERERERAREAAERAREATERSRDREQRDYERGQNALDRANWADAVARFQDVIAAAGGRVDAAMYWKAYALDRLGQRADALTTVAELVKAYPKSRWLADARALEVQVRGRVGQPITLDAAGDEELKLLALNALQNQDPAQAVPLLQQILTGSQSLKLKERALFVLAQSSSPEARKILAGVARQGNPDLQRKAIDYLGVHGSQENRALLAEVYQSTDDVDVKRRILRAYMVAGDRARVLAAATGESNADLRMEGVRQLGVMGAHDELWQLYQKESSVDVKRQILQAMFVGGNAARLIELARSEPNADLRRTAVRNLGLMGSKSTGQALVDLYSADKDVDIKKAAVNGLFVQNNAEALVTLARKESDPVMKKELVQRLSVMKSKVAIDYLMEILGK